MNINELKKTDRIQVNVDESDYGYDYLIQIKDETIQECERCLKLAKLWIPEDDGVVGLCDECLVESYGEDNIKATHE